MSAESKKGTLKSAGMVALSFAIVVVLFTANVPGPVAVYHEMAGGISNDADAMLDSYRKILKKFEKDLAGDPELLTPHHRAVARGLAATRHGAFARSLLLDLISSGRALPVDWVWLAVTVGGQPLHTALRTVRAGLRRLS